MVRMIIMGKQYITKRKYYYLYQITNLLNHKIYIGVHATDNINDGYMGSGSLITKAIKKYGKENFKKEILQYFDNAIDMLNAEARIVTKEFVNENTNYNIDVGGNLSYINAYDNPIRSEKLSRNQKGKHLMKDIKTNKIYSLNVEQLLEMEKTIELVGITYGFCMFKHYKTGEKKYLSKTDPLVLSGEYVGCSKGLGSFKNVKTGEHKKLPIDDPLVLSGEYVGITAGCKQTKESNRKRSETQRGKSKPQKYFECPVCHTITVKGNLIRWHKHCKEQFEKEHNNERYNLNLKEISRS